MVRLKRTMSVFKHVTIREEKSQEAEVWIAVLRTTVTLNSVNPVYDALLYKENIVIEKMKDTEVRLQVMVPKRQFILRFASKESLDQFCCTATDSEGLTAPCPSPSLSISTTPSPPRI